MADRCVCCGEIIPEGRFVCFKCTNSRWKPDAILEDGTPLYIKTPVKTNLLQLDMYAALNKN